MSVLDIFALIILLVLLAVAIAVWVILGMMPGKIARSRNHPQAEAINVCGWWGVITLGILLPVAWIWAYTNPPDGKVDGKRRPKATTSGKTKEATS